MPNNLKSVLVGLTKESGPEEISSALGYALSLANAAGAHLTVQAAAHWLHLATPWVGEFAADLVAAENTRLRRLAEAAAANAQAEATAVGVAVSTHSPQLSY